MKSVRITVLTLVSLACLLTLGPRAHGQEKQEPISEAKRQLILQIIEVMNQQTSTVESMDAVTREMARMFDQSYEAMAVLVCSSMSSTARSYCSHRARLRQSSSVSL